MAFLPLCRFALWLFRPMAFSPLALLLPGFPPRLIRPLTLDDSLSPLDIAVMRY